ncbi:MAG: hypothetical protein WBW14_11770 [Candidatus Acidiferrum sp.]|jgi:hypothetical protein
MDDRQDLFRYSQRPQRFLLSALVKGLANAVRRNDGAAAYRYHVRAGLIARQFDTNPRISAALEQLLSASSQWSATKVAERYEAEQQVFECIERIMELL